MPRGTRHLPADVVGVYAARGGFEQDVYGVAQQFAGACEHEEGDENADDRVGVAPAGQDDNYRGGYGPDRAEDVGDHVPEGAFQVQALAFGAGEDQGLRLR